VVRFTSVNFTGDRALACTARTSEKDEFTHVVLWESVSPDRHV
jgi:hypothetical protein